MKSRGSDQTIGGITVPKSQVGHTCTLGSLAASATATVTLVVKPTAPGTITNMASATGNPTDPSPGNNSATAVTTVTVPLCAGLTPTKVGTPGNDMITGTSGNDVIHGLGSNDIINGGNGNDIICGGNGNGQLFGENGNNGTDAL